MILMFCVIINYRCKIIDVDGINGDIFLKKGQKVTVLNRVFYFQN